MKTKKEKRITLIKHLLKTKEGLRLVKRKTKMNKLFVLRKNRTHWFLITGVLFGNFQGRVALKGMRNKKTLAKSNDRLFNLLNFNGQDESIEMKEVL